MLFIAVDRFFGGIEFPKLAVEEAEVCEGTVTAEEAGRALDSMKNGPAPDGDGLTIEFFMFCLVKVKIPSMKLSPQNK